MYGYILPDFLSFFLAVFLSLYLSHFTLITRYTPERKRAGVTKIFPPLLLAL